ncbi:cytoadherence linked asexual protein, putative [Plasmodium relictum]|uniref:Cytoadherence linked asexual protein, putative n=1 Tax=Plasmodium relictum TaxID=85471 RepID=A0A1J1H4R7_PLARL|nr:cytoadherence linked asexual protein, putative [Plasmodium relictum]CRG99902.1 cytoadherence linked asexual protein, putative [Plasmodium relictum]
MIVFPNAPVFIFFFFLILKENANCFNQNENITQLRQMIDNIELYEDLLELERLIIQSLELDELKLPILKEGTIAYPDLSNFKKVKITFENKKTYDYIIPTPKSNAKDLIEYEHITKKQLMESYNSENSNLIKRKNLIVRTLRIVKLMLEPMNAYKRTRKLKQSLIQLNDLFTNTEKKSQKDVPTSFFQSCFQSLNSNSSKIRKKNMFPSRTLGYIDLDILHPKDLFFTIHPNIDYMRKLDKLSIYYDLGIFNLVGSHLIALGHFIVLRLALKKFFEYFKLGVKKFFSWQTILHFNISDRFKALDLMCDSGGAYQAEMKRRKTYLKKNIKSTSEDCSILEVLIHYINKYQLELLTSAYQANLKIQALLEYKHVKEEFFNFMCNGKNNCNIYDSYKFKSEYYKRSLLKIETSKSSRINPFNLYINFFYFIKSYNYFSHKNILYVHFLNLTGILNRENKAYVGSIYLPGYYNAVELSFNEDSKITDLYENLLECVDVCHKSYKNYKISSYDIDSLLNHEKNDSPKCNMCKGTLFYINSKSENNISMLQKFYIYITEVVKVNNINSLIKDMNVYEDYDNFLTHDINWYTFLLLFRLTTYKDISHKNVSEAMYLNLKKEDMFKRTITTSYWFPSPIKKAYSLYVRKNKSVNLVEKLEKLLSSKTIDKMKKCIQFMVHVNSFLQLDFFYYLNEPPLGKQHTYPLSMLLESKFKKWHDNSLIGYFFLNYEEESMRKQMQEKIRNGEIIIPKYSKWILILKKYIEKSYESYFNQRNVKNLYKYHDSYNINNKIMLMRDSYDLYSKNYEDIIFFADIFNLRKHLTATPPAKKRKDKLYYFINAISGNTVNLYKYGIIYGFTINEVYLKEIVDELLAIYKIHIDLFSDISFLQTVYLLFRKIEKSFRTQRRNDKISMNNVFFLNVRNDYSKLNKEERKKEINNSMASKFFSKTLFSVFQMMFSMKLSNDADDLDKKYGSASMIGLTVEEKPFVHFAYAFYGSIMDSITNSFLPIYAKKPITQLKYGKTFIFSNLFKLCHHIYSILNLNNLSILCENQAVTSANYYSNKKVSQFIDRKFLPVVLNFFVLRVKEVAREASTSPQPYINQFLWPKNSLPICQMSIHLASSIYMASNEFFPSGFRGELREQTKHSMLSQPSMKPSVHGISKKRVIDIFKGVSITIFMHHFMRWYAFYENVTYVFGNIRVFERFYRVVEHYIYNFLKTNFKKMTTDIFLNSMERAYTTIKNRGYQQEAIEARISAKKINKQSILRNVEEKIYSLTPQDIETLLKDENTFYIDDDSFFEETDENEMFLNERKTICYRDVDKNNSNLISITRWAQRESKDHNINDPNAMEGPSTSGESQKTQKKKNLNDTEDNETDNVLMISRNVNSEISHGNHTNVYCDRI